MATTIEVNKQSVKQLLESGTKKLFVIPEYQRPYAWTEDQVQTLFDDLWEFTTTDRIDGQGTYFLGSIVSFTNDKGEQEIIDGQQRITSLFLLLRAIYTKLNSIDPKTVEAENFIRKIEPTIWKTDELTGKVDYNSTLLVSRVVDNKGNDILKNILKSGLADRESIDNYSKNYNKFVDLLEEACKKDPTRIYYFINDILNNAILLPIQANEMDTALTIFSTLNDRGLQLSDADIFKAQIYKKLKGEDRQSFIKDWQSLVEASDSVEENSIEALNKLFYYYMFYLRALDKDNKTTTPGLRKYFMDKGRLFNPSLMTDLTLITDLWKVINKHQALENEPWSKNKTINKTLDILTSYPNEFWKYPVVIYYICHHNDEGFESNFESFLKKLCSELLSKYLIIPNINAVKADILKLNVECTHSLKPKFEFKDLDVNELEIKQKIKTDYHKSTIRMMLKLLAYEKQDELLPEKWEIEHIFPQKYQESYIGSELVAEIENKLEHLGNKLPFEKKLNITASNNYFDKKKEEYALSKIVITNEMSQYPKSDWKIDEINERDIRVSDIIYKVLLKWKNEYVNEDVVTEEPTEQELAQIEKFKKKGWVK